MNKSLFLQLYISVAAVIITSILLVSLTLDFYYNTGGEADFVADISFVESHLQNAGTHTTKADLLTELTGFDIQWLTDDEKSVFVSKHPLIDSRDGFEVMRLMMANG
jgi:hypothetical protein